MCLLSRLLYLLLLLDTISAQPDGLSDVVFLDDSIKLAQEMVVASMPNPSETKDEGDKSSDDPKSCTRDLEVVAQGRSKYGHIAAISTCGYGIPTIAHGICTLLKQEHEHKLQPGEVLRPIWGSCDIIKSIIRASVLTLFAIAEVGGYEFGSGKKDLHRITAESPSLLEGLRTVLLEAGFGYDSIYTVPIGKYRRAETENGLQETVQATGLSYGNSTFDLTYRGFGSQTGLITISNTLIGPKNDHIVRRDRHNGVGIQLHYAKRHSPLVHTIDKAEHPNERAKLYREYVGNRNKIAENIADHWARRTDKTSKRGYVGFVETVAPKGQILWSYKGRKITREANFYFKIVSVIDGKFAPRYESVDSPCGGMAKFLDIPIPDRDKEL